MRLKELINTCAVEDFRFKVLNEDYDVVAEFWLSDHRMGNASSNAREIHMHDECKVISWYVGGVSDPIEVVIETGI